MHFNGDIFFGCAGRVKYFMTKNSECNRNDEQIIALPLYIIQAVGSSGRDSSGAV